MNTQPSLIILYKLELSGEFGLFAHAGLISPGIHRPELVFIQSCALLYGAIFAGEG